MKWHTFEVMSRGPYCVTSQTELSELLKELNARKISAAPVLGEEGSVLGLVSLRDLALANPEQTVAEVMSTPAIIIDQAATIPVVLNAFVKHKVHRLVVTHNDRVLGIVSLTDLLGPLIEAYGYPNFL